MQDLIQTIEETSLTVWPSLQQIFYDGWLLRFSEGFTDAGNSIASLHKGTIDDRHKIKICEHHYSEMGLRPSFRISPLTQPEDLDSILKNLGYLQSPRTSVQTVRLPSHQTLSITTVKSSSEPSDEWFDAAVLFNHIPEHHQQTYRCILEKIPGEKCFMSLYQDDWLCACGFATIIHSCVALHDLASRHEVENKGYSRQLALNLLHWASSRQGAVAYLDVPLSDPQAGNLASSVGFKELYQYWYRAKTSD
ncbi:MAG: GNAT family N-acetyltransferase [bacterium]